MRRLPRPLFGRVGIVGFGLIGSSVARALRAAGATKEIYAFDGSSAVLRQVRSLGLADKTQLLIAGKSLSAKQIPALDLLLLATPLSAYEEALRPVLPCLTEKNPR